MLPNKALSTVDEDECAVEDGGKYNWPRGHGLRSYWR